MSEAKPNVEPAAKYAFFKDPELKGKPQARRTAVLVLHGMGQQRKFETMSMVAAGIERVNGAAKAKRVRNVRFGDEDDDHIFSRMELDLADGRGVDLYEAYWAPVTEGEVTMRDVTAFLFCGAWNGIRNSGTTFRRWVFGELREFKYIRSTKALLYLVIAIVLSLMFLNAFMLALGARKVADFRPNVLASPELMRDFMAMVLMFFAVATSFAAVYFAAGRQRKPDEELKHYLPVSYLGLYYVIATALYTIAFAVMTAIAVRKHMSFVLGAITIAMIVIAALICLIAVVRSRKKWLDLLSAIALLAIAAGIVWLVCNPDASWLEFIWPAMWAVLLGLSAFVRSFLVQFIGDVAAYVTPSQLDRFDTIRSHIKKRVFDVANAIYRGGDDKGLLYDSVVIVGHSLGSVAAYDVLNRMLNDDARINGDIGVLKRTKGLVTFGSILDKTAFIFETNLSVSSQDRASLATTVQPLIEDPATKAMPWKNVHSKWDIFTGELNYYDLPDAKPNRVEDVIDYDAVTPIGAHTEYWINPTLWRSVSALI